MATTKISKKQLPVDVVYSTDLGDQINEHNLSPVAHQDIRDSLATATILPSYNSATHKITFTTIGGDTYEIDLPIENAVDNVSYNSNTYIITVHKLDGSSSTIDLSGLMNTYTGGSSAEATVTIDANNEITANINAVAASKISYDNTSSGLSGATTQAAIDELASEKVDKITGKQLSTEDYTTAEKTKLSSIENNAEVNVIEGVKVNNISLIPDANKDVNVTVPTKVSDLTNDSGFIDKDVNNLTNYTTTANLTTALNNKVDKVNGKQLSTEDYTTAEKTKLAGLENYDDTQIKADLTNKVDKVSGKGLSTEDYTTTEKNKLNGIENNAEVNIIETVKVNGTALTPDIDKAVDIIIPAAAEYTITEIPTTIGYAKSYQLKKDNTYIGAKIDIPKDLVVSAGEVKTVDTPDVPYAGAQVGDKYVDLTLNDPTASHIYIPVNDLVDAYSGGNGIEISNANVVSAKIDSMNANGLSVGVSGIALAAATTSAAGAMSASDKTKLDAIESNADVNIIEIVKVNGTSLTPDANKAVDVTVPAKVSDLTNDSGFIDKDVNNLTNYTKTSSLATVATSGSYNDLSDQPTIPTVNNATLTIQKNSTTIDTFTANASVDKTIDISVPIKVSDLTNDSGFIDKNVNNLTNYTTTTDLTTALNNKVDKINGKGLSTEDYTTAEKTKLGGIANGAQVNTIETIKINGNALTPDVNKAVDITVTPSQYETMPTAASAIEGKIIQYIGTTTTTAPIYTNGYFYKCVESSETAGTYLWEEIDVMDVSEYVTAENIQGQVSISAIPITPLNNTITYNMFTSDVKGRFVETFSGTTNPDSSLGKDGDIYFLID